MIPDAMQLQPLPLLQECQPCSYLLEEMWTIGAYDCLYKPIEVLNNNDTTSSEQNVDGTISNVIDATSATTSTSIIPNINTSVLPVNDDDDFRVSTIGLPVWSDEYFVDHAAFSEIFDDREFICEHEMM
jgi:hypothetical protein